MYRYWNWGTWTFFLDFVIDLAVVYDTFVAVMLLCVCRLSLYLTIISQYRILYSSALEHPIQNQNKMTSSKPPLDCI